MERKKVESSQLESVGYDSQNNKLEIEFKGGSLYVYDNIEPEIHDALMKAESVGSFFIHNIKKNSLKYPYTRIENEKKEAL